MEGGVLSMTGNVLKIVGMVATLAGLAVGVLTDYVNEQKMNEMIDEKINARLALETKEEEE